ncbi:MAG TPA: protein-L-isoaspartate O-methyltransferase [Polyangiaceae bacterium]|nr:protein-L-isoaspartate O-methyltransferase [Polyangiaceae bacterium]
MVLKSCQALPVVIAVGPTGSSGTSRWFSLPPEDKCLEIGTGSGYQAAILAEVCAKVFSIEYLEPLADFARSNLRALGYGPDRVALRQGDGYRGWPEAGPFDVVVVTAAPDHVPRPLFDDLALGGRLIIPVGASGEGQRLELWTRTAPGRGDEAFERRVLAGVCASSRFSAHRPEGPLARARQQATDHHLSPDGSLLIHAAGFRIEAKSLRAGTRRDRVAVGRCAAARTGEARVGERTHRKTAEGLEELTSRRNALCAGVRRIGVALGILAAAVDP